MQWHRRQYEFKKQRQNNALYTIIAAVLICSVFFTVIAAVYIRDEEEAYEMLHIQTKQIKDNLTLQIKSEEYAIALSKFSLSRSLPRRTDAKRSPVPGYDLSIRRFSMV